ncbi:pilus assembly PilX family protein [Legionella sp. CNM-4043-24]|uniref:pilus assembly PilX family protein n=1 Tax=Legionella sp. CNM-4043-24 TaxID=3421646 RepID=UPI00403B0C86
MSRQRGTTLAIALLMLLVLTLLGISTIQVTSMQEKMTANLQDKELSFRAAESALAAGEIWLMAQGTLPRVSVNCTAWPCVQEERSNFNFASQSLSWWAGNSTAYASGLDNVNTAPRYVIEFLQFVPDSPAVGNAGTGAGVYYYQITARGTGSTNDSVSILQTTVARRF